MVFIQLEKILSKYNDDEKLAIYKSLEKKFSTILEDEDIKKSKEDMFEYFIYLIKIEIGNLG